MNNERLLERTIRDLTIALGERLRSVVLYGPAAHGEAYRAVGYMNLMLVLDTLDPDALRAIAPVVHRWLSKGQPWPRLFTPEMIESSVDVFPLEFLELARHRRVLVGVDPLAHIDVGDATLRLQCERELRVRYMRLMEGYVEAGGRRKALVRLLTTSYLTFVNVFRGCLRLYGIVAPDRDDHVVRRVCELMHMDPTPFRDVQRLAEGGGGDLLPEPLFDAYRHQLERALAFIDRDHRPQWAGGRAV